MVGFIFVSGTLKKFHVITSNLIQVCEKIVCIV